MTVTDAARLWGVSPQRVRALAAAGRVHGAKLRYLGRLRAWVIPDGTPRPPLHTGTTPRGGRPPKPRHAASIA